MQETYENFLRTSRILTIGKLGVDYTLSDLAVQYQTVSRRDAELLFSRIYCDLYKYTITVTRKYFNLTEEDKDSFALEELSKSIRDYDVTKGATIQTFYSTYLNRRLYMETSRMNNQKRIINTESKTDSYDSFTVDNNETGEKHTLSDSFNSHKMNEETADSIDYSNIELIETLKQLDLSESEIACCRIITENNHKLKNTEIGEIMDKTSAGVAWIKKTLKVKLEVLITT